MSENSTNPLPLWNRHERRKALKRAMLPQTTSASGVKMEVTQMFRLPKDELEKVLVYERSPHQEIPTDVLLLMLQGTKKSNPQFAALVSDWIAMRNVQQLEE